MVGIPPKSKPTDKPHVGKTALAKVSATPAGQDFLAWFCVFLDYKGPTLAVDPVTGAPQIDSMVYNEARRGVWLALRKMIPTQYLNMIESEKDPQDATTTDKTE